MTTVGYGDKTPKTMLGRAVATLWMLSSLVLVSLLSTSLVSRLAADRVESRNFAAQSTCTEKSSRQWVNRPARSISTRFTFNTRNSKICRKLSIHSLTANPMTVVNSVGALQYYVSMRYARSIEIPQGLLASAYIAIAPPEHSAIKKPLDRALVRITNSPEWRTLERCLGHVMPGIRGTYDRHEYFDEKRRAFEALAGLIDRILDPQSNVTPLRRAGK
jgi:polar amino acid transport system substrate-binding protein